MMAVPKDTFILTSYWGKGTHLGKEKGKIVGYLFHPLKKQGGGTLKKKFITNIGSLTGGVIKGGFITKTKLSVVNMRRDQLRRLPYNPGKKTGLGRLKEGLQKKKPRCLNALTEGRTVPSLLSLSLEVGPLAFQHHTAVRGGPLGKKEVGLSH